MWVLGGRSSARKCAKRPLAGDMLHAPFKMAALIEPLEERRIPADLTLRGTGLSPTRALRTGVSIPPDEADRRRLSALVAKCNAPQKHGRHAKCSATIWMRG